MSSYSEKGARGPSERPIMGFSFIGEGKEMVEHKARKGRVRAWMLLETRSPAETAHRIYRELGAEGGDRVVLVRVDVVEHRYNLVVAVDAESGEALAEVHHRVQEMAGTSETALLPVVKHFPHPPHDADGFITPEEAELFTDDGRVKVGRQKNSPGMNPWG
jgi:hypothetical protein